MHAAVLGSPVQHSRSPALHRAAYAALGLEWTYDAIECTVAQLPGVLAARRDWAGFSCTMPLKRTALELSAASSPTAAAVGAANTLVPMGDGQWGADNTDVDGIVGAVREVGIAPVTVTVLGAGGTAQAVVAALPELGLSACQVLVRDPGRTAEITTTARAVGVELLIEPLVRDAPALGADLVVAALPPRAADAIAEREWRADQTVLDVIYAPWPTAVAAAAAARGTRVIAGGRMLLHQAARQVELMTGHRAPLAAMAAALDQYPPGSDERTPRR